MSRYYTIENSSDQKHFFGFRNGKNKREEIQEMSENRIPDQQPEEYAGTVPDEAERERLYRKAGTPRNVIAHMRQVWAVLEDLLAKIDPDGERYSRERLKNAALLHDVLRLEKNHAQRGAAFLEAEGWREIAALVAEHHSGDPEADETDPADQADDVKVMMPTEADLLFYADKRVQDDRVVSVQERFAGSLGKCRSEAARQNHQSQLRRALRVAQMIQELPGIKICRSR